MFLVEFRYHASLERIDALREAHYANPDGLFQQGHAVAAGPLVPRTGGVVIADGTREQIDAAVATDPFVTHDLAAVHITEFRPTYGSLSRS